MITFNPLTNFHGNGYRYIESCLFLELKNVIMDENFPGNHNNGRKRKLSLQRTHATSTKSVLFQHAMINWDNTYYSYIIIFVDYRVHSFIV